MAIEVHSIRAGLGRAYLIVGRQGLVLVDTGSPGCEEAVLQRMQRLGRADLRLIFITHAHLDHYGSAAALRRRTGAVIAIHRADAEAMARAQTPLGSVRGRGRLGRRLLPLAQRWLRPEPTPADRILGHGDDLSEYGVPATVRHTPGHTAGSASLVADGRVGFAGDLFSTVAWAHAQHMYAQDWAQLADSLRQLRGWKLERIYPGHGRRALSGEALAALPLPPAPGRSGERRP